MMSLPARLTYGAVLTGAVLTNSEAAGQKEWTKGLLPSTFWGTQVSSLAADDGSERNIRDLNRDAVSKALFQF